MTPEQVCGLQLHRIDSEPFAIGREAGSHSTLCSHFTMKEFSKKLDFGRWQWSWGIWKTSFSILVDKYICFLLCNLNEHRQLAETSLLTGKRGNFILEKLILKTRRIIELSLSTETSSLEDSESDAGGCIFGAEECRYPGHRPKDIGSRTMPGPQSLPRSPLVHWWPQLTTKC